jgi:hypothetical protein
MPTGTEVPITKDQAEKILTVDAMGQYQKGLQIGTPPPPFQFSVGLKFPTITVDLGKKGSWSFKTLNQPSISITGSPSGVGDQIAIDLFNAVWKDQVGHDRIEAAVSAFVQNFATSAPVGEGVMLQVEAKASESVGFFVAGSLTGADGTDSKWAINPSFGGGIVIHLDLKEDKKK